MVSSKARVQRKAQYNAPAHTKRKMLSAHLSKELAEKYGRRTARVCVGDTVAVVRGEEKVKGVEAKVIEVFTKTGRVSIDGVTINQADGTAVARPIHASNLVITKLNLDDPLRAEALNNKEAAE
ncbi:ribosomal protein L24p/L26e, archaeal/eukaryotic [Thermoplasmatales archaeon BRNA1]|nr:ribosomal protein L24p/L26e, archaeal/eukaryotic [Thermoplasmatales archaeon BRNA1]